MATPCARSCRWSVATARRSSLAHARDDPRPIHTPIWPLYKVEHAIAQLGRWRRLSRCYVGTTASARAWLEVASVGYLAWRAVV